ncbi:MAG: histidine kinase N-terminal 7TM domain-containing protein [Oscillospiraceae bacterium]
MKKGIGRSMGRVMALALLCLFSFFLCGCARSSNENIVYCTDTDHTPYPEVLAEMLPSYSVERAFPYVFSYLQEGAAAEAFDAQAVSALENDVAQYWYPQYLATVVIAIDRERTDAPIKSWNDLPFAGEVVAFADESDAAQVLMAAMSYGLEGEAFTLTRAAGVLAELQAQGRLARRTFDEPIVICFDHQAAALIKSGRNIEILVPSEGTLTFSKGLLSNTEISFAEDVETALLAAGLRLPGGQCDDALYPGAAAYENADRLKDYTHLNTVCQDVNRVLRRNVLHTRMYSSADQREHQYFVMLYIILVIICTASFIQRAMQKGVRRAALFTGIILLGWIIVRLIKYQCIETDTFNRYLWYAYYLFQLSLPLVLLWLAWAIDKQDERIGFPKWLRVLSIVNAALVVLVFTNDWHKLVFRLDLSNANWSGEYGYGVGYYAVLAGCVLPLLAALGMMLVKSGRNPRKKGFAFPLAFCVLLALYGYGYVARVPLAWDSDFAMVTGLFTLLFVEACVRTRLIPVNSKYTALFTHSPLNMQIFDNTGQLALSSRSAMQTDKEWLVRAAAAYPLPVEKDENTLLFAGPITGGTALWQEDISALNRLHREIEGSVRKLAAANAVLAEEEKIRRALDAEKAKTQLMEQLEAEIAGYTSRLAGMIEQIRNVADEPKEMLRIALLLCYIKRRCNLFFRQRETDAFPADELTVYMDELAEIAGYGEAKVLVTSEMSANMPVRVATLFYDFFYAAIEWAVQQPCLHMLVHLGPQEDTVTMRLLTAADAHTFVLGAELDAAIKTAGGRFALKDLDEAMGISLSFPKGGGVDG